MKISRCLLFVLALTSTGCVGPLVVDETARSVGRHNSEFVFGGGQAGYALKYTFGLGTDFDLGIQLESASMGFRLKYALLNQTAGGWSIAVAGGVGSSTGGSHVYGDLMASYLAGWFEPFGTFRYVQVKVDPTEIKSKETNDVIFTIPSGTFSYGEAILGSRMWMSEHWLFTVEVAGFTSFNGGVTITNGVIVNGAFGYRF